MFNTPFHDMRVNAFLMWDPKSRKAIAFDTGADCRSMLDRVAKEKLAVKLILLTHAHTDHIADLARLKRNRRACLYFGARVHSRRRNDFRRSRIQCWQFEGESIANLGHSRGGMTFFVTGLARPVAIVGDSIFAGSMGGGNVSYKRRAAK